MSKTTLTLIKRIPRLLFAEQRHDFDLVRQTFKQIGLRVKIEEVGYDERSGLYVALAYNKYVRNSEIRDLMKKHRVKLSQE